MKRRLSIALSLLTIPLTALFLLSAAIAVPILWRGFYYGQIDSLSLVARTGFSPQVIRGAFDEVMDYLVLGRPFGTGQLAWSQSGMAHFADCRVLFRLDFLICAVSGVLLIVVALLSLARVIRPYRFRGHGPCFWGSLLLAALFLILGLWAYYDFDGLFTVFHTVFFPGKTNWVFDWRTDQIILILPEDFWARAAGLVAVIALAGGVLVTLLGELVHRKGQPKSVYEELLTWEEP